MANSPSGLSAVAIRRPVFTSMVMAGLVVLGLFSFRQLNIDQFPNIDFPVVTVQTVYQGASPETIEREVTKRMEEAFNTVQDVKRITSISVEGVSQVIVEFQLGRNVDQAAQDIRSKIETIRRDLPLDIDPPLVQKFDPASQPILSIALSSDQVPMVDLTTLAEDTVRRRLESVPGVGEVRITGGLRRQVRINLLPGRLRALDISVPQVIGALQQQNLDAPAGHLQRGISEQLVRVTGRITQIPQFGNVILATRNGDPVRLKDVARIAAGTEEERSLALVNGKRALAMDILKVSGANTVEVADQVRAALGSVSAQLPPGVNARVVQDNSVFIRNSVNDVIHELILGAILTVIVVMLFLNDLKATAITSLALPVSVISAFILLNALHFTLNLITLMALSLSIGILIDDAIVVIENIVRHREMGEDHFSAAGLGTKEIVLAVMATTFSIVAVFIPVAFMGGIVGRFFYQFGLTVAWAVLVSLFVSFTLTPMLSAWWGVDPHSGATGTGNPLARALGAFNRGFDALASRYPAIISWALDHRKSTIGLATAAFIGALLLFPLIGGGFMPDSDASQFSVNFKTPEGSSLAYTHSKADQIGDVLRRMDGVAYTYTTIGSGATGTVNKGNVFVKLVPENERPLDQAHMEVEARRRLQSVFGTEIAVVQQGMGGAQSPLQVQIRGPDIDELQRLADELQTRMAEIPGVVDIASSAGEPRPEYRIQVNRDVANEVGLNVGQIAQTVRPYIAGQTATHWEDPTGEERDVVVQVEPDQRASLQNLEMLPVAVSPRGGGRATVPLGQVAAIERGTAPAEIDRQDLERVVTVSAANTPDLSLAEASSAIRAQAAGIDVRPPYSISLGGQTEMLEETVGYVLQTILLAIILIFLILASQFESYLQPLAIMLSLPLSLVGVLLALLITGDTLNMMSMIGVILLMGLVTKNAILLVDNANERRTVGKDRRTALVEAGQVRLRPIMMTTLAMIFGMLPIALALGEGSGFRAPMARAVIGGLITSTMLTLIVVPVAYTYADDLGSWVKRHLVSKERERQIKEEQQEAGLAPEPIWGD